MGAEQFENSGPRVADDAGRTLLFNKLVRDAQYDHGHAGYTGTIAEKSEYVFVRVIGEATAGEILRALSYQDAEALRRIFGEKSTLAYDTYDDKWGPALSFDCKDKTYFCGWASS